MQCNIQKANRREVRYLPQKIFYGKASNGSRLGRGASNDQQADRSERRLIITWKSDNLNVVLFGRGPWKAQFLAVPAKTLYVTG
ncbi:hypothetical protein SAE02_77030 [Skermanella aerolata]|uniref:Uncharacterized protein n=1 Tax=Skermanella aerolata TaxID=393310 RepID=A0A512E4B4_9PROT|nr:hypothetical protein SAE02_77030 [Skermanella aerolata]